MTQTEQSEPRSGPGSMVDLSVIQRLVNKSQQQGKPDYKLQEFCQLTESYPGSHTPQG